MRNFIVKKAISKNGYFNRELLVELMQPKRLKRFVVKKFYKKFLRIGFKKPTKETKIAPKINALERMARTFANLARATIAVIFD